VVSNDGFRDGRSDSIDLCSDTSTLNSDTNIEVGELVLSEDKNRLENLQSHNFRLNILNGLTIDFNETPSLFRECDSGGRLFPM